MQQEKDPKDVNDAPEKEAPVVDEPVGKEDAPVADNSGSEDVQQDHS